MGVNADDLKCDDLKEKLTLRGRQVGDLLADICDVWPAEELQMKFPLTSLSEAEALLNTTFKEGGIYDQAKALANQRKSSGDFCWRRQYQRPVVEPTGYSCPARFHQWWGHDKPTKELPKKDEAGGLFCEKNCTDICGDGGFMCISESKEGLCGCRSKEPESVGTGGPMYVFNEVSKVVPAVPDGCDMTSTINHATVCYGECPNQSVPTFVVGNFKPICSNACAGTNRSFPCGFGCAVQMTTCASTVVDQLGQVMKTIGDTVGFMTGNVEIAAATEAVVSTAEFGVTALATLVSSALTAWTTFEQNKQSVGLLVALSQVIKDVKADLVKDRALYQQFLKLVSQMTVALKGWHGFKWHSSLQSIIQIFLKNGPAILHDVYTVLEAFMWPHCEISSSTEDFSTVLV